ncbi:MAG: hypothetical protein RLZZ410_1600 [Pseudomonadota bacterium]|jgi:hypothetical protein
MKKIALIGFLMTLCFSAQALELVCKGYQPRASNQRPIYVDCSDRKAVIDSLGAAWSTLHKERIGGQTEDMCWRPYNRAKEMHPSIQFNNIAPTFFMECNMAMQYVK